ncbi:MAG: endonuclease/exonuclease/phosphatase family protein [Cyanobacteria bacterium]|nr:endonuclease/exonuclease/phosphatase family protein [Cyanobacteriota bacterium]MDW8199839.1 endonuclease/exonuclease/phosphatase family protein [Cyanobacteriota bacterium SKYGB_h_bin112]
MGSKSFRVGTFNVFNLTLPGVACYGDIAYTPDIYDKKRRWIADQLIRMKADIVGFQEVFHEQALKEVLATYDNLAYEHVIVSARNGESPAVALASRFPVLDYQIFEKFPSGAVLDIEGIAIPLTHFSRPILAVRLNVCDQIECTVYVVHLKSKRPVMPEGVNRNDPIERAKGQARALILRAAEATALRMILMETLQGKNHPVILIGDVNDSGLSVTSRIVSGEPPGRDIKPDQKQRIWDTLLYPVKDIQGRRSYGDFYFTHIHGGHYESLDHIMVSQEFVAENPRSVGKVSYVSVLNDHLIDESLSRDEVEPWQSDHGQVVATIDLK